MFVTLTETDLGRFRQDCQEWLNRFHLQDWKVYCGFQQKAGTFASCFTRSVDKTATIKLTQRWDATMRPFNEVELAGVSLHEVLHILLADQNDVGRSRFITEDELEVANEALVHRLEAIISEKE